MAQTETEIVQGIGSDYAIKYGFSVDEDYFFKSGRGLSHELVGPEMGALVITHYQRILDYVTPDRVHVFVGGRIVESGGAELAKKLEKEGYVPYEPEEVPA